MCCIFTCFGWMIDLIQRFWSFAMSCCISSAVCCLLIIASMSGIALGYNYSLAEYIDLKESNVSIFLKRGIFDDEISDLQLRRANEEGGAFRSGAENREEITTLRSGRRLDDSVFESGDQNKYEGSLMKLTARPPFEHSTAPQITEDVEMQLAKGSYTKDSLDALKAVQSVIDARRAYAQTIQGPTHSPVPTYKGYALYNEERVGQQNGMLPARRRMTFDPNTSPSLSPARLAVPGRNIGAGANWVAPYQPLSYVSMFKNYGLEHESTTYPSSIPFKPGPLRPTPTMTSLGLFITKFNPVTLFSTRPTFETEMTVYTKNPKVLSFKEKLMAENDRPLRKHRPKSDEEYDYDIKGLPVRKRRSINLEELTISNYSYAIPYELNKIPTQTAKIRESQESDHNFKLNKNFLLDITATNEVLATNSPDVIHNKILKSDTQNDTEHNVVFRSCTEKTQQRQENTSFNQESTTETPVKRNMNGTMMYQNLFIHIMTNLQLIKKMLFEPFLHAASNDNDDIRIKETLFISKIVSNKSNVHFNSTEQMVFKDETFNVRRNISALEQMSIPPNI